MKRLPSLERIGCQTALMPPGFTRASWTEVKDSRPRVVPAGSEKLSSDCAN